MKKSSFFSFILLVVSLVTARARGQDSWIQVVYPCYGTVQTWACEDICWKSSTNILFVVIDYSLDYGKTWQRVPKWGSASGPSFNDGVSYWNPPWVWNKHAMVRVSDAGNPGVFGVSEPFTIMDKSKPKSLTFVHPSAGESYTAGSTMEIEWISSGNIFLYLKMELSWDGGKNWFVVNDKIDVVNSPFRWRVWSDLISENCMIRLSQNDDEFPVTAVSGSFSVREKPADTQFKDATARAGISLPGGYRCASWADLNGDDREDLFVTADSGAGSALYLNLGDKAFSKSALQNDVESYNRNVRAGVLGDLNGDGWLDLFLGGGTGFLDRLFLNDGSNRFSDVTSTAGIQDTPTETNGTAFLDYNLDGKLDIFVCHWQTTNALYRNNGDGTFTDVAIEAGVAGAPTAQTSAVAVGDYNNDGFPDLYVVNSLQGSNALYKNNGNGTFSDVTNAAGVSLGQNNKSAEWGDFNNDGRMDLFVVRRSTENVLFIQNPEGSFSYSGRQAGVANYGEGFAMSLADFDDDGFLDILVANNTGSGLGNVMLFLNNGDGTFLNTSGAAGFLPIVSPRGVAVSDYDNDGDPDVFITDEDGASRLYENTALDKNGNHWIKFNLHGRGGNWEAIGARVQIVSGGKKQIREIQVGTGYGGRNSTVVHFGLGSNHMVEDVRVFWPSGSISFDANLEADKTYFIQEKNENKPGSITMTFPDQNAVLRANQFTRVQWQTIGMVDSVMIDVSTNNGQAWTTLGKVRNVGYYNWLVPEHLVSESACIRVKNARGGQPSDTSGLFAVECSSIPLSWHADTAQVSAGAAVKLSLLLADSAHPVHRLKKAVGSFRFSYPQYVRIEPGSFRPGPIWGNAPTVTIRSDSASGEIYFEITDSGDGFNGFGQAGEFQIRIAPDVQSNLQITFQQEGLLLKNTNGDTIPAVASSCSLQVIDTRISVWPGDTNNDGKVNHEDVLPVGIYYGTKGSSRTGAAISWQGQRVSAWTNFNAVYSDANGDGTVDDTDLTVIRQNWGRSRGSFTPVLPAGEMPSAMVLRIQPNAVPDVPNFSVDIRVSNGSGFHGAAFILYYYATKVTIDSVSVHALWRNLCMAVFQNDSVSGTLRMGISFKSSGPSQIPSATPVTLWMKLKRNVPNGTPIIFKLDSVLVVNSYGKHLLVSTESGGFVTGISDGENNGTPSEFRMYPNYPNPFNPSTRISYDLPMDSDVMLRVLDLNGKEIYTFAVKRQSKGRYTIVWNGEDSRGKKVPSGMYLYQMVAGQFRKVGKCTLLK